MMLNPLKYFSILSLLLWVVENLLHDYAVLPQVVVVAVHLVIISGWMSKGDDSETFLLSSPSPSPQSPVPTGPYSPAQ